MKIDPRTQGIGNARERIETYIAWFNNLKEKRLLNIKKYNNIQKNYNDQINNSFIENIKNNTSTQQIRSFSSNTIRNIDKIIEAHLENGGNINAEFDFIKENDIPYMTGCNVLHYAACNCCVDAVHFLYRYGIDINNLSKNNGNTILHNIFKIDYPCDSRSDCHTIIDFLFVIGCNPYIRNYEGYNAIDMFLLNESINIDKKNNNFDEMKEYLLKFPFYPGLNINTAYFLDYFVKFYNHQFIPYEEKQKNNDEYKYVLMGNENCLHYAGKTIDFSQEKFALREIARAYLSKYNPLAASFSEQYISNKVNYSVKILPDVYKYDVHMYENQVVFRYFDPNFITEVGFPKYTTMKRAFFTPHKIKNDPIILE